MNPAPTNRDALATQWMRGLLALTDGAMSFGPSEMEFGSFGILGLFLPLKFSAMGIAT